VFVKATITNLSRYIRGLSEEEKKTKLKLKGKGISFQVKPREVKVLVRAGINSSSSKSSSSSKVPKGSTVELNFGSVGTQKFDALLSASRELRSYGLVGCPTMITGAPTVARNNHDLHKAEELRILIQLTDDVPSLEVFTKDVSEYFTLYLIQTL